MSALKLGLTNHTSNFLVPNMPSNLPTRKQILDGEISFVSIDTNVILEEGPDFNKGRLNQIPNVVPHSIVLHLTEVTAREVARHFHDNAHQLQTALSKTGRLLEQHGFTSKLIGELRTETSNLDVDHYLSYIREYVERCRGNVLAVDQQDYLTGCYIGTSSGSHPSQR